MARLCSGIPTSITASRSSSEPPGKEVYDPFVDAPLPVFEEGECRLVLPRAKYGGFGLLLKLPGKLAPTVPIYEFVMICEFRAMMERFDAEHKESFWHGYYLSAYTEKLKLAKSLSRYDSTRMASSLILSAAPGRRFEI